MQGNDTSIYTTGLKPYKTKKLFFSHHFRSIFYNPDWQLSVLRCEYKLCTHMWLQRFREEDIEIVLGWWYSRHNLQANWGRLRHQIIPDTYRFTRPILKKQRHEENLRAQGKRTQKVVLRRAA